MNTMLYRISTMPSVPQGPCGRFFLWLPVSSAGLTFLERYKLSGKFISSILERNRQLSDKTNPITHVSVFQPERSFSDPLDDLLVSPSRRNSTADEIAHFPPRTSPPTRTTRRLPVKKPSTIHQHSLFHENILSRHFRIPRGCTCTIAPLQRTTPPTLIPKNLTLSERCDEDEPSVVDKDEP